MGGRIGEVVSKPSASASVADELQQRDDEGGLR
ncbi:hypothetical protein JOF35_006835 [Streptomyces demainii]|uniref:Uncharacterized protein n=1 Tax=Streptomyces demainii TaxID=588122 RepID=A0ABT9L462_9ACTN|nr:hypothetical protein [Streptomyces demainii]